MKKRHENIVEQMSRISFGPYQIDVTPMTMSEWLAARALVGNLPELLERELTWDELISLFGERAQDLISVIAIAARLPREQVSDLHICDVIELLSELISVNAQVPFEQRINDVETRQLS